MANKIQPIVPWGYSDSFMIHPELVWSARLDKRYLVEVVEPREALAQLRIFDHSRDDKLIHVEPVTLAYGAIFGPDVNDVNSWQKRAVEIVESSP